MSRPYSVVHGRDRDVLPLLLQVRAPEGNVLDCTYNRGRMWKGLSHKLVQEREVMRVLVWAIFANMNDGYNVVGKEEQCVS